MSAPRPATALLLAVCAWALGCRPSTTTALHVRVDLGAISTEQLELSVFTDSAVVVSPTRRPAAPAGPLASPQDVFIYLPDVAQTVTCRADSVSVPLGRAEAAVSVTPHQTTEVALALTPTVLENGQPCTAGGQCGSTFCVDGVCCDSSCDGTCAACDVADSVGACTQVPAGQPPRRGECTAAPAASCGADGKCDGKGGCRKFPAGMECAPATCTPGASGVMSASRCDGAGNCVPSTTSSPCDPYLCDATSGRCFTACGTVAECAAPNPCNAGKCGKKPNSDSCADGSECNSAHCSDGVCCNVDCAGACTACNVPGATGICTALPAGAVDPHSQCTDEGVASCGASGLCNGLGGCQKYPASTVCAPVSCSGASVSPARLCDGAGTCMPANTTTCPNNFVCNTATGACFTSCTANDQCAMGFTCHQPGRCR